MDDLEMTGLCAEAMGHRRDKDGGYSRLAQGAGMDEPEWFWFIYDPIHDDAQAMALVKRFGLRMIRTSGDLVEWSVSHGGPGPFGFGALNADLNRSICECVAKMQAAKAPPQ